MQMRLSARLVLPVGVLVGVLLLWALLPMGSRGATSAGLNQQIQETQSKIQQKKGKEQLLTTDISGWTAKIRVLERQIAPLQRRQDAVQTKLDVEQARLDQLTSDLARERARAIRLRGRLAEGRTMLAERLRERYIADAPDIVTVILSSDGFAQLLERSEFLRRINEQDRRVLTLVRDARAEATTNAARLTGLEARQRTVTAKVVNRRNEIVSVKQELVDVRLRYSGARAAKSAALASVRADRHELEGDLSKMQAEQQRIQGVLNGAPDPGPIRGGSGEMIWPVNGPITSPFCETRAWERCHPGIDIGVVAGTPIRAALGGRVALAGPTGGYGNYTCLQHDGALSTCYAHQSRIAVSVGQLVAKGQVIGYVGCTGWCFGDHLHFEVRINGAVSNPMNYL